jgi:transposase
VKPGSEEAKAHVNAIRAVGPEHCILSSDLGQANNPLHPDGLLAFYQYLAQQGFTQAEIDRMAKVNPAKVLGLEPWLPSHRYTYAEVTPDEQLASWIGAHVRAFEFFQGTPKLVVPDNAKTGITKACRYDPDLNPTYQEMAMHYGVGVVPARPYKPRDKAKAESGVLLAPLDQCPIKISTRGR